MNPALVQWYSRKAERLLRTPISCKAPLRPMSVQLSTDELTWAFSIGAE